MNSEQESDLLPDDPGPPSPSEPPVSRLPLLIAGVVVAMIALLTVALVATRKPASYAEGSPEEALQGFVTATLDHDEEVMLALVTDELRARCASSIEGGDVWRHGNEYRAELESLEVDGDTAEAVVELRELSRDVFGGSSWDTDIDYELERVDGAWRIAGADWPWALQRCSQGLD